MRRNDRPAFRHRLDFRSALVAFWDRLDFNSALVAVAAKERAARRSKRIFAYLVQKQVLSSHVYDIIKIFL